VTLQFNLHGSRAVHESAQLYQTRSRFRHRTLICSALKVVHNQCGPLLAVTTQRCAVARQLCSEAHASAAHSRRVLRLSARLYDRRRNQRSPDRLFRLVIGLHARRYLASSYNVGGNCGHRTSPTGARAGDHAVARGSPALVPILNSERHTMSHDSISCVYRKRYPS
jgi:hypothetical protein